MPPAASAGKLVVQAVAGFSWTLGYFLHVWWASEHAMTGWPVVMGAYCLAWELFVSLCGLWEIDWRTQRLKFIAVNMVNASWFAMDICLISLTVLHGNGVATSTGEAREVVREEMGLFPTTTVYERAVAVAAYTTFFLVLQIVVSLRNDNARRFIKYHSFIMIVIIGLSMARLPVWRSIATLPSNTYLYASVSMISASHVLYWASKLGVDVAEPQAVMRAYIWVFAFCTPLTVMMQDWVVSLSFETMRAFYVVFFFATLFPAFVVGPGRKEGDEVVPTTAAAAVRDSKPHTRSANNKTGAKKAKRV